MHKRWHREQATPKFRCPKCHYISPDQEQCDTHVQLHETAEPLQCVICQTKYSDIRTLKKHIRIHVSYFCSCSPPQNSSTFSTTTIKSQRIPSIYHRCNYVSSCVTCAANNSFAVCRSAFT